MRIAKMPVLMFLFFLLVWNIPYTQNQTDKGKGSTVRYDSAKAKAWGADDYGMKRYVMAFLKRGPNRPETPEKAKELQAAHLQNIERLAEEGKLVLAGPFLDNGELRGIYIFNVPSVEEAKKLTETDPAIQAGSLIMELKEWYGSAALMAINDLHKSIQKQSVIESAK